MKELRRKGAGLRLKFTLLVVVLVILVVLIVAVPLGYQMTNNQQTVLATGLRKQSEILIGSLTSAAMSQIKLGSQGYATIADVPEGRKAMPEALYATITGPSADAALNAAAGTVREFVWASDEKKWQDLRNAGQFAFARDLADDELAAGGIAREFQKEIEEKVGAALGPQVSRYLDLRAQRSALEKGPRRGSSDRLNEIALEMGRLGREIDRTLAEQLAALGPLRSFPAFETRTPVDRYVFYYPIVYFNPEDPFYYHGMVRLAVGTAAIRQAIMRAQLDLVKITGAIALLAVALGVVGAIILANITVTPIRRLVKGVAVIRDTEDKEELKSHTIQVGTRDEIGLLAETVNEMTQGLARAAAANKMLLMGKDVQKMFLPLEKDEQGRKRSTAEEDAQRVEIYGYYEGAKGVSGDFFDFRRLDESHYAFIKSDASGKGVPAALIMVEVATLFINYFRDWQKRKANISAIPDPKARQRALAELERVDTLVATINDMLAEREFKGMFATLLVGVLNTETGVATVCHAGDRLLHLYNRSEGKMMVRELPPGTAAGVFHSQGEVMKASFSQVRQPLASGDALFLFTDGFEEAKRHFLDGELKPVVCDEQELKPGDVHQESHKKGDDWEEFGIPRIEAIVNAVFRNQPYSLVRCHLAASEELTFDFSKCTGDLGEAVLALVAVEKVFRLIPDPSAGPEEKVVVDTKIDGFLRRHFVQYDRYFSHRVEGPAGAYVTFTHLREDDQYDDLTIVVIRRK